MAIELKSIGSLEDNNEYMTGGYFKIMTKTMPKPLAKTTPESRFENLSQSCQKRAHKF